MGMPVDSCFPPGLISELHIKGPATLFKIMLPAPFRCMISISKIPANLSPGTDTWLKATSTAPPGRPLLPWLHRLQIGHHLVYFRRAQELRERRHLRLREAALVVTNIVAQLRRGEERG